jgi:site-specific DNA-cytosine methylase
MVTEFTCFFPFCGIGGGAMGFLDAEVTLFGKTGRFRSLGGIDIDDGACQDFSALTKSPALCADMTSLAPAQLREVTGQKAPDVVFLSAPCVGSSKLISDAKAQEPKYRALNKLSEVWIDLMLATWGDAPPGLVLFENVPNLTTRAKAMLGRVKKALRAAGYVIHDGYHCAGEIGGLAQRRRRWLMVARHARTIPPLLYQPVKRRVRGCGEVIGPLPMPGDPAGGAMHTLPKISWLNWVRLALIPAGGDWRDLPGVVPEGGQRRAVFKRHEVCAWDKPCGTVGGPGSNGVTNIADARAFSGGYGVRCWDAPFSTVTGESSVSNGASVADPRPFALAPSNARHNAKYAVGDWKAPAKTVTGATRPGSGSLAVNDPRVPKHPFGNVDRVTCWDEPVGTITRSPAPSSGGGAVADPRIAAFGNHFCKPNVADANVPKSFKDGYGVLDWSEPVGTVTGSAAPTRGRFSVPDPRSAKWFNGFLGVVAWNEPARTVTGKHASGIVADPRVGLTPASPPFDAAYGVLDWTSPSRTVAGGSDVGQGAYAVGDPRLTCAPRAGAYGVLSWQDAAKTITGAARLDNGPFAIADVRVPNAVPLCIVRDVKKAPVGGVPVILAADGTWHRPLTTLELAALQGFPARIDGRPLVLSGTNATEWRRRIGNAVPPPAAKAIAERMLTNLLAAASGAFLLDGTGAVWVAPQKTRGRIQERARVRVGVRAVAKMERAALIGANT